MKTSLAAISIAVAALTPAAAHAVAYNFTLFDVPGAGFTSGFKINNHNVVVGDWRTDPVTGDFQGFTYDNGAITVFAPPGDGILTLTRGNNDAGTVVGGSFYNTAPRERGFSYDGVSFTEISVPGSVRTGLRDINNNGVMTGRARIAGQNVAILYDGVNVTQISLPGATSNIGEGLNDAGQVVGTATDALGQSLAFYYDGASTTSFAIGAAQCNQAWGINNAGDIVGVYTSLADCSDAAHGFVRHLGVDYTVDVPGAAQTDVLGINDDGWITGAYIDANGATHAFIGSPIPEPATLALLALGLAGLGFSRRKQ